LHRKRSITFNIKKDGFDSERGTEGVDNFIEECSKGDRVRITIELLEG